MYGKYNHTHIYFIVTTVKRENRRGVMNCVRMSQHATTSSSVPRHVYHVVISQHPPVGTNTPVVIWIYNIRPTNWHQIGLVAEKSNSCCQGHTHSHVCSTEVNDWVQLLAHLQTSLQVFLNTDCIKSPDVHLSLLSEGSTSRFCWMALPTQLSGAFFLCYGCFYIFVGTKSLQEHWMLVNLLHLH